MANIEHPSNAPRPAGVASPTYRVVRSPFPDALPELDAVGHSRVGIAQPAYPDQQANGTLAIVIPRRGGQRFIIDGLVCTPTNGDMLLIQPYAQIGTGDDPITRIDAYDLYIRLDLPRPFLGHRQFEPIREQLLTQPTIVAPAPEHAGETIRRMYVRLVREPAHPITLPWVILKLGSMLTDILEVLDQPARHREPEYVRDAEAFMQLHLHECLDLPTLSEAIGYSRSTLVNAFRKHRGVPPMEFFLRMKIQYACEQLANSPIDITTLALDLGFSSSQYFATSFKRFTSSTPSQYRQTHGRTYPPDAPDRASHHPEAPHHNASDQP